VKKLSKKAIRILTKVKEHILEEPKRLDMDQFAAVYSPDTKDPNLPACKTQGCIAGWTILLEKPKVWKELSATAATLQFEQDLDSTSDDTAADILGIDSEQADNLFFFKEWIMSEDEEGNALGWPETYARAYDKAKTLKARASVTAKRIDHFIATNGAE
jgi:hypothetical protein